MKILHVIANPKPEAESNSKQLANAFFTNLLSNNNVAEVVEVDLYDNPPPYYIYDNYRYNWYPVFNAEYQTSKKEDQAAKYSKEQISLFNSADVLVITAPMWNFSMPAILKSWLDQVLAPRGVFNMGENGVEPLHHIKKAIILTSSGGAYSDGDSKEHLVAGLKAALGFVKITNIEVAWADGQNTFFYKDSVERKSKAIKKAEELSDAIYNK